MEQSIIANRDPRTQSIVNSATINPIVRQLIWSKIRDLQQNWSSVRGETKHYNSDTYFQRMTFLVRLMSSNKTEHLEPVLVSDLHMSKYQGSRREHWGCQHRRCVHQGWRRWPGRWPPGGCWSWPACPPPSIPRSWTEPRWLPASSTLSAFAPIMVRKNPKTWRISRKEAF